MWYPQILNSMTDYGKIESEGEVTMCKSILYEEEESTGAEISPKSLIVGITTKFCTWPIYRIFSKALISYIFPV